MSPSHQSIDIPLSSLANDGALGSRPEVSVTVPDVHHHFGSNIELLAYRAFSDSQRPILSTRESKVTTGRDQL